jgi:hypothetical protein
VIALNILLEYSLVVEDGVILLEMAFANVFANFKTPPKIMNMLQTTNYKSETKSPAFIFHSFSFLSARKKHRVYGYPSQDANVFVMRQVY